MITTQKITRRKKPRLVYGVGVNDAEYQVNWTEQLGDGSATKQTCPFYRVWKSMLFRCYNTKFHAHCPTYRGCSVAPEWLVFSTFSLWMRSQQWAGLELDKDILLPGNTTYSPDTCVFIPHSLNSFTLDGRAARGEHPIGVSWDARKRRFKAKCKNPSRGVSEHLGWFASAAEAHEAWRTRKHQHAVRLAGQQADPRVAKALRTRYAKPVDTPTNTP